MSDRDDAPRVVRLSNWLLEVIVSEPDKPWDRCIGAYNKRKDAEKAAALAAAKETRDAE